MLADLLPDRIQKEGGGDLQVDVVKYGYAGASACPDDPPSPNPATDEARLLNQVRWAANLERPQRFSGYPDVSADIMIISFGSNDHHSLRSPPAVPVPEPDWWTDELKGKWPRSPEDVVACFDVVDDIRPDSQAAYRARAYVALPPPANSSITTRPIASHNAHMREIGRLLQKRFSEDMLIDFYDIDNDVYDPAEYGRDFDQRKYFFGNGRDSIHFDTQDGQPLRAAIVRDKLCQDDDRDCVRASVDNCPGAGNPKQEDGDGDGLGDACDDRVDAAEPQSAR